MDTQLGLSDHSTSCFVYLDRYTRRRQEEIYDGDGF